MHQRRVLGPTTFAGRGSHVAPLLRAHAARAGPADMDPGNVDDNECRPRQQVERNEKCTEIAIDQFTPRKGIPLRRSIDALWPISEDHF